MYVPVMDENEQLKKSWNLIKEFIFIQENQILLCFNEGAKNEITELVDKGRQPSCVWKLKTITDYFPLLCSPKKYGLVCHLSVKKKKNWSIVVIFGICSLHSVTSWYKIKNFLHFLFIANNCVHRLIKRLNFNSYVSWILQDE